MAPTSMPRVLGWAAVLGSLLGIASAWFDGLPVDTPLVVLVALANAVGPWLVAGFLAGTWGAAGSRGAVAGVTALGVGVVAYYVALRIVYGDRLPPDTILAASLWLVAAALAGSLFGAAGGVWASGSRRWRAAAVALLAGGLLAEAADRFIAVEGWTGIDFGRTALQVAAVDLLAAVVIPVVLLDREQRAAGYAWSVAIAVAGAGGLHLALMTIEVVR